MINTGYAIETKDELQSIAPDDRADRMILYVAESNAFYRFKTESYEVPDDDQILSPHLGDGQWLMVRGAGSGDGGNSGGNSGGGATVPFEIGFYPSVQPTQTGQLFLIADSGYNNGNTTTYTIIKLFASVALYADQPDNITWHKIGQFIQGNGTPLAVGVGLSFGDIYFNASGYGTTDTVYFGDANNIAPRNFVTSPEE